MWIYYAYYTMDFFGTQNAQQEGWIFLIATPGKKCSIFGIKIYQKRTMIYRDKNKCLYKFMDFHEKSRFLL